MLSVTRALVSALVLLNVGCVPTLYDWRPGAKGTVLDESTGQPLEGVLVRLEGPLKSQSVDSALCDDYRTTETRTDQQGRFRIAPIQRWWLMIPLATRAASAARLTVSSEDHVPHSRMVRENSATSAVEIKLRRK